MKKENLKVGYLVETRGGALRMVMPSQKGIVLIRNNGYHRQLNFYNENLTYCDPFIKERDIVKVWGYSHYSNTVLEFDIKDRELLWERKETPKLTEDEKTILRNIDEEFEYIVRDEDNELAVHTEKPSKLTNTIGLEDFWGTPYGEKWTLCFSNLFQFIQWEDEEPYNIQELLKEESQ